MPGAGIFSHPGQFGTPSSWFSPMSTGFPSGSVRIPIAAGCRPAPESDRPVWLLSATPITGDQRKYPARVRAGPDWLAFVSNWMTEWERTGNTKYRDKILAGMESLVNLPYGFRSGKELLFGYDPADGRPYKLTDVIGDYNLATIMGGAEVIFELNDLIYGPDVLNPGDEIPGMGTNGAAQSSLLAIELLQMRANRSPSRRGWLSIFPIPGLAAGRFTRVDVPTA